MIHIIGNSHVNTFSGLPHLSRKESATKYFKLHYIGATTARYMYKVSHMKVHKALRKINVNDWIIPLAGEVDCRFHIPLQADKQKVSDSEMVDDFIEGFMETYDFIKELGYKIISFGCHPSTTEDHNMDSLDKPVYGSPERRNNIALLWNKRLKEESDKRNIPYFDIYKYLVNGGNETNMDYYIDYCHLNGEKVFNFLINEIEELGCV